MPDARDVGVDRHVAHPEREQQHAGGGLAPDARQRAQVLLRLRAPAARASQSSDSSRSGAVSVIARRIDLIRADLTFEIPPGRIASSISSTGASRTSAQLREALAQRAGRRRRGCGRWSTATARSGSARRSGGRGAWPPGSRRPAAAGRGLARAPGSARGLRQASSGSRCSGIASVKRPPPLAGARRRRRPPRAAPPPPPTGEKPLTRQRGQQRAGQHVAGADRVDDRRQSTPGDVGAQRRRAGSRPRRPASARPAARPPSTSAAAARSGSLSPVISCGLGLVGPHQQRPGTQALALAAASAREPQRCRRRLASKITGRPSSSAQLPRRHRQLALAGADQRVGGDEQRRRVGAPPPRTRPSEHRHDRPVGVAVELVARLALGARRVTNASGVCNPRDQLEQRHVDAAPRSSRARSHAPQTSSPAPPASATARPGRGGDHRDVGRHARRSAARTGRSRAARSPRRSPTRSTSASPRQRVRIWAGAHARRTLSSRLPPWPSTSTRSRSPEGPSSTATPRATGPTVALPPQRPDQLRRLGRVPGAQRRDRARPARLRALGQGRPPRLHAPGLRRLPRAVPATRSTSTSVVARRTRLGRRDRAGRSRSATRSGSSGLVLIDAVPLLDGFQWPRIVAPLAAPGVGELADGLGQPLAAGANAARRRGHRPRPGPTSASPRSGSSSTRAPSARSCACTARSTRPAWPPPARTSSSCAMPALVRLGRARSVAGAAFADALCAGACRARSSSRSRGAGHWPWLDQPAVVERVGVRERRDG